MTPEDLARLAAEADRDELPAIVGALAQAHALALARLVCPEKRHDDGGEARLLSMPDVARRLGVSEFTAREMGRRGELPTVTIGDRSVRVRASALEEWIRRRELGRTIRQRGER